VLELLGWVLEQRGRVPDLRRPGVSAPQVRLRAQALEPDPGHWAALAQGQQEQQHKVPTKSRSCRPKRRQLHGGQDWSSRGVLLSALQSTLRKEPFSRQQRRFGKSGRQASAHSAEEETGHCQSMEETSPCRSAKEQIVARAQRTPASEEQVARRRLWPRQDGQCQWPCLSVRCSPDLRRVIRACLGKADRRNTGHKGNRSTRVSDVFVAQGARLGNGPATAPAVDGGTAASYVTDKVVTRPNVMGRCGGFST
jgi:hypothetical protein